MDQNNHSTNAATDKVDPSLVFETLNAFQKSAALVAAVELDLFSAIAQGHASAAAHAKHCQADERGVRIACDYLVVQDFLSKSAGNYALTPVSAKFLDRASPAFMGSAAKFVASDDILNAHRNLAQVIRAGKTQLAQQGTVSEEYDGWVEFARSMGPMMLTAAHFMADVVAERLPGRPLKVLDIAAGHGLFGITIAQRIANCQVTALDWPQVLEVAKEHARERNIADYRTIVGDAFTVDYGNGYDVILLTNILHHFPPAQCVELLRKVQAARAPESIVLTLEFIPNEDRVSPPVCATFALTMLATTPQGDAYTLADYQAMWQEIGTFEQTLLDVSHSPQRLLVTT